MYPIKNNTHLVNTPTNPSNSQSKHTNEKRVSVTKTTEGNSGSKSVNTASDVHSTYSFNNMTVVVAQYLTRSDRYYYSTSVLQHNAVSQSSLKKAIMNRRFLISNIALRQRKTTSKASLEAGATSPIATINYNPNERNH